MLRSRHTPTRRRATLSALTAGLVLTGTAVVSTVSSGPAGAATLGVPTISPTSGNEQTLFDGSIANAACPAGTTDSYWTIDGPDLPAGNAIIGFGNATGTGPQSFDNGSIANVKSTSAGSFHASGTYNIRFNCFGTSSVTDTYTRRMAYTYAAGGAGTWALLAASTTTTTLSVPANGYVGSPVSLTATVSPSGAGGKVQFKDGGVNLGSPVTVSGGSAKLSPTLAQGTHSITAVFTSADLASYSSSNSAAKTVTINGAPTWRPVLYPAPRVGAVSLCLASFANAPTSVTYSWFVNGVVVSGATGSSYTVPESAYTKSLACKAKAQSPAGSVEATSSAATVGIGRALVPTTKPYIYGTVKVGYTVVAKVGAWNPAATSYLYAWYVGTTKVSSSSSYKIPSAYKGKALSLLVTARRTGWTNGSYKTAGKVIG